MIRQRNSFQELSARERVKSLLDAGTFRELLGPFDDPGVAVHAMSKQSAARITKRSVGELDSAADQVPGIAYDIRSFDSLGAVDVLLGGIDADHPSPGDVERVRAVLEEQIALAVRPDLGNRLESEKAKTGRRMSVRVREELERQWNTQRTIC